MEKSTQGNILIGEYSTVDTLSKAFQSAFIIYGEAFPKNESRSVKKTTNMLSDSYKMYVAQECDETVGMALVYFWDDFTMLDYMAVKSDKRGQGVGEILFKHVCKTSKTVFLEVQKLDPTSKDNEKRAARIRFYERYGCHIITDKYLLPSYDGTDPEEMNLMVWKSEAELSFTNKEIQDVVSKIHKNIYNCYDINLVNKITAQIT